MSFGLILTLVAFATALLIAALRRRAESQLSRALLKSVGPRTDTPNMGRTELLQSSAAFLKFALLGALVAALCFWGLSEDKPDTEVIIRGTVGALTGLIAIVSAAGGLWLGFRGLATPKSPDPDPSEPIEPR